MAEEDKFCFIVDWYDPNAAFIRHYQLVYYPKDSTIEMFDMKNHRSFLRRTKAENVRPEDLYIGSRVNILGRQLTFTSYGDKFTEKRLGQKTERTLGMIKPDATTKLGPILDSIYQSGFLITKLKMCQMSRNDAFEFYQEHQSKDFFNNLVGYVTTGPVIAFELMGANVVMKWRELLGPTDSVVAKSEAPLSLRARFGTDTTRNACHGSDSAESAARELNFFFGPGGRPNTATCSNCTCAVIKPHAVLGGSAGQIIQRISEHFTVSALQMFTMERANAEEFYEVYKGVVQEYPEMVKELTAGPIIALEIKPKGGSPVGEEDNTAKSFREFVGPGDPEIARHLRANTLRAQYGKDKIQNAVHCTDLPEDALLEVQYFFKILEQ